MRPSQALYSALAPTYEEHFEVPHRRAYDTLAWERVRRVLPGRGPIVDAGCGVGRWVDRLVAAGHTVIGIEQSPGMLAELRRADRPGFTLVEGSMETAELAEGSAAMVMALGSLQYTADPEATVRRFARWVRPGGRVVVLVDSLMGLVLELLRDGRPAEATERLRTRMGVWRVDGQHADMHLFDAARLRRAFEDAGLTDVEVHGLLVTAAPLGVGRLTEELQRDWDAHLALERELLADPAMADAGKQLLATGRRPTSDGDEG
ncbi:class I SAM-dependent methyltransferase [Actinoallomurus rhizosphaericola]|uniref:class I SAM-dependent methyltransferase n=1 Tax=Actinoallomurus rhizosphaericola TaxID=2952536 RepID=UPI002090AD8B|nr:class I SAM-dependent methyltransferase [Actinoallomurus rhizosphaericola]MCO5993886.1 class I SAM-dependent methyltransferase [Actinoallomurus rhizosphaericola]